jgi:hypothetical protein
MATTWTDNGLSANAVCTTGTEAAPGTTAHGLALCQPTLGGKRLSGVSVTLAADSGQTLSGAGTLTAYVYHPDLGMWSRAPDLDLGVTSTVRAQTWFVGTVPVGRPGSRIAYVPTGVTMSAGGLTAYLDGDL